MPTGAVDAQTLAQEFASAFALLAHPSCTPAQRDVGVGVAQRLLEWGADRPLIEAALLHEALFAGSLSVDAVAAACGEETAALCRDYALHFAPGAPAGWRGHLSALKRVRLYTAAWHNPSLALLAAAHLWYAAAFARRSAGDAPASSLAIAAGEPRTVLLPFLDMLGMREVREQLAALPGADLGQEATGKGRGLPSTEAVAPIAEALREALASLGAVDVQPMHPLLGDDHLAAGSLERAESHQQNCLLQVTVPSVDACYLALHRLHRLYRPIDGALADAITACRPNGHRSLQSVVVAPVGGYGARVAVEIVTPAMERVNRWGVAAFHFAHHRAILGDELQEPAWEGAWWLDRSRKGAAIGAAPLGSQPETVVVFSPKGQPFPFARGSTVVDYAYGVHSGLAEQCERFLVNGEPVEPATVLRHLDLVELEHSPRAVGPTQHWLTAAHSRRARTLIRRFLRRHSEGITDGQRILDARLHALESYYGFHVPDDRVAQALARGARQARLGSADELLAEIAGGRAQADRYLNPLFTEEITRRLDLPRALKVRPYQVQLAQCCRPRPGESVAGLPYVRNEQLQRLTVHRTDCPRFRALPAETRAQAVPLSWRLRPISRILVQLEVTGRSDDRLMGEALEQLYEMIPAVRLFRTDAVARRGTARLRFAIEADSDDTVEEAMDRLRRMPNREISQVRKLALPPSEVEALTTNSATTANPYSRMPVNDPTMFFGRADELQRINEWLHNGVSCIWLRGQKRVGKTSLMLHLRHHFWEPHEAACAFVDFQLFSDLAQANIFYELARAIFSDMEKDPRVLLLGPPERSAFEFDAPQRFIAYLRALHQRLGARRLVLLLDEFSRLTDLFLLGQMSGDFFQQWRGVLMGAGRFCTFVAVMQQRTFESLHAQHEAQADNPCWQLQELGEDLPLRPFDAESARRLVEWPMQNFVTFEPGVIDLLLELTGGSPFLIQSFCNRLVAHIGRRNGSTATLDDLETVAEEFMAPSENVFAHLLDMAPDVGTHTIVALAQAAEAAGHRKADLPGAAGVITLEALQLARPDVAPEKLQSVLGRLEGNDILVAEAPGTWRFNNTLFQRWLARNG
jgi:(p)ppGpp synthase/HD superfamily hydrolase